MFEKKYKINYSAYVCILNLVIRELNINSERIKSLTINAHMLNHNKNTTLRLFNAKQYQSKLEWLFNYLQDLR